MPPDHLALVTAAPPRARGQAHVGVTADRVVLRLLSAGGDVTLHAPPAEAARLAADLSAAVAELLRRQSLAHGGGP